MKWIVSQHDLPVRANKDLPRISSSSLPSRLEDMEVILVEGNWPAPNHLVWALQSICVAVRITCWVTVNNKKKKRKRDTFAVSMST